MRQQMLVVLLFALGATASGCAECQADCAGPEVIIEVVDASAVAVEARPGRYVYDEGSREAERPDFRWFPVAMD